MEKIIPRREESDFNPVINLHELGQVYPRDLPPIESLINQKQRKRIIKKIFKHSADDFQGFLRRLDPVNNWREAYIMIESELMGKKVPLHLDEVLLLTSIVYRRYYPNDEEVEIR